MSAQVQGFGDAGMNLLAEDAKLALLATVTADGLPHVTLITSMRAKSRTGLMFGQFCEGWSKLHVANNPLVGFLALDRGRRWLRGKARWCGSAKQGEDYEAFNRRPMFRYNAYFGIHTVHYLDLVEVEAEKHLATGSLVTGALSARLAALVAPRGKSGSALTPWSRKLIAHPASLKFLAYVGADGHPVVVPAVAAATRDAARVVVVATLDRESMAEQSGRCVALFAIDLEMRSVLLRGTWTAGQRLGAAFLDVDWVYNTMPPKQGQIYPASPLEPVRFAAALH